MRQGLERREAVEPLLASRTGSRAAGSPRRFDAAAQADRQAYRGQSMPAHALAVPIWLAPLAFAWLKS